jgi:hypothetical protein
MLLYWLQKEAMKFTISKISNYFFSMIPEEEINFDSQVFIQKNFPLIESVFDCFRYYNNTRLK